MTEIVYLVPLFFLTALVYASVGFGGGSTYLALLVLFQFPFATLPKMALFFNLVVVAGGLYHYIRSCQLDLKRVFPFVLTSVPLAFWGGKVALPKDLFLLLLGICLAVAGLRLFFFQTERPTNQNVSSKFIWGVGLPAGGLLGFLSGLVGIGGGIFLAPILYFLGWGTPRQIAAMACFFIFVNSLAGLAGQLTKGAWTVGNEWILPLGLAVFLGGQIGSRFSVGRLPARGLQKITALLIFSVSIRIFWEVL